MTVKRQISIAFPRQLVVPDSLSNLIEQVLRSLLGGGVTVAPAPVQPPTPAPPVQLPPSGDLGTLGGISERFLEVLGSTVEDTRVSMVAAWVACEKPASDPAQWNNPMNTTLRTAASVGSANSVGVQIYATIDDGIEANVRTLEQANMTPIRNALFAGDPAAFAHAFSQAPWGTSAGCVASRLGV